MSSSTVPVPISSEDDRWMSIVSENPTKMVASRQKKRNRFGVHCFLLCFCHLQHKRFLSECREKDAEVLFIGDCVLETLQHTQTWNQYFAPMHSLNFSIYSDETQNTLWRIQNGALDNVKPKVSALHRHVSLSVPPYAGCYRLTCVLLSFDLDCCFAGRNQ